MTYIITKNAKKRPNKQEISDENCTSKKQFPTSVAVFMLTWYTAGLWVFLSMSRKMQGYYFEIGHDS